MEADDKYCNALKAPKLVQEEFEGYWGDEHCAYLKNPNDVKTNNNLDKSLADSSNVGGENNSRPSLSLGIPEGIVDSTPNQDGTDETNLNSNTPDLAKVAKFGAIQTLPTPLVYTPQSPAIQSPTRHSNRPKSKVGSALRDDATATQGNQINIIKRRGKNRRDPNTNPLFDEIATSTHQQSLQNRIISELVVPPLSAAQRVMSLPMAVENTPFLDSSIRYGQAPTTEADDASIASEVGIGSILTGYRLNHYDEPLHWKQIKVIGIGNFSDVLLYESIDQMDPELMQVAVKRIKYPKELLQKSCTNQYKDLLSRLDNSLAREISVLRSLRHPCIVKLFGLNDPIFGESKKPLYTSLQKQNRLPTCNMIMSYCAGGDLLAALTACSGNLEKWLIQRLFSEIVLAVEYLHNNDIIHRDLKLENIFLKFPLDDIKALKDSDIFLQKGIIELGDFGLCKKLEPGEMCTARCGSEDYVSPEILMGISYDGHLSDTWALGVILYSLLEDRLPFDYPPNATPRQRNRATTHRIARYDWRWYKCASETNAGKTVVENTLTRKNQRWDIHAICQSNYVKEVSDNLTFGA